MRLNFLHNKTIQDLILILFISIITMGMAFFILISFGGLENYKQNFGFLFLMIPLILMVIETFKERKINWFKLGSSILILLISAMFMYIVYEGITAIEKLL